MPDHTLNGLLDQTTLGKLPPTVRRPAYDRSRLRVGLAHIGVGAFHRCHQAEYTEDMLEVAFGDWGILGINVRPPGLAALALQDGLYSRTLRQGDATDIRIIGCIKELIDAQANVLPAVSALGRPELSVVTMSVTEKGYCHVPATGELDWSHPDIRHDLEDSENPRSLVGLLATVLDHRRRDGLPGLTLISCDNIASNGKVLESVVGQFVETKSPELARWIRDEVRFPSTMVDRIVPATNAEDVTFASRACGFVDRVPVVGEPFRQWVIEDAFATKRPPWDAAGAQFVAEVQPYELIKMRLLNAAQSAFAYFGALCGLQFTCDSAADSALSSIVRRMLTMEALGTLKDAPGMLPGAYVDQVFERISNPAIRHVNHQVATDGSQKLIQRMLNPIRERRHLGLETDALALAVSAWVAYLLASTARFGSRWPAQDPLAQEMQAIAARESSFEAIANAVVNLRSIFGDDLQEGGLAAAIADHLPSLLSSDVHNYLRQYAGSSTVVG